MSVDSLLQHIVLSQQHAQERRRLLHEVKSEFNKCHEKIIEVKEKLREAKTAQENKVTILLEKECERDLLKKRLEVLEFQKKELLRENHNLRSKLLEIKDLKASEEETFMKDVWDYNNNYGLTVNRKQRLRERAEAEGPILDEEINVLGYEIEALRGENIHLNALHRQRNVIQRELSLDKEISAAAGVTKILEAEKLAISQRPQSDDECLRLKKELESYREENTESAYEALCTEIESLQQIDSSFTRLIVGAQQCGADDCLQRAMTVITCERSGYEGKKLRCREMSRHLLSQKSLSAQCLNKQGKKEPKPTQFQCASSCFKTTTPSMLEQPCKTTSPSMPEQPCKTTRLLRPN
ncbi:coiled-coil domain-containing protein 172 isoform X2 [Hyla sarda]|uniref:coiled-coil domain-containing protein 172 isoform X2 n=1 Tax=Hyla sarda TaxID=327740 RepID=UPI0024C295F1|nr:coiled-coil domain-containing protein 172 isoform X2 [Hyla sarda]